MAKAKRDLAHDACAKALMSEYGVPKGKLDEVVELIVAIHDPIRMPHCSIIKSIRGFMPVSQTRTLENFLEEHKTHEPKHKKGRVEREPEWRNRYEEPSYDR